jgi:hypothetical protein
VAHALERAQGFSKSNRIAADAHREAVAGVLAFGAAGWTRRAPIQAISAIFQPPFRTFQTKTRMLFPRH